MGEGGQAISLRPLPHIPRMQEGKERPADEMGSLKRGWTSYGQQHTGSGHISREKKEKRLMEDLHGYAHGSLT